MRTLHPLKGDSPPFQRGQDLAEAVMCFLQGEPSSERLDEGVGVLDLEAVHKTESVLLGKDDALYLGRVFIPSATAQDILTVFHFGHDAVLVALEIDGFGDILLPGDLNLRRPHFLCV